MKIVLKSDGSEHLGRHRQFPLVERAQPLDADLVAVFRDLVDPRA